jgi:hypothetical protein
MPAGRTVIAFVFVDAPANKRRFWLVCNDGDVDVCIKPPTFESDVTVRIGVQAMAEIWRGLRAIDEEIRAGRMQLEGKTKFCRAFPRWLMLSAFAQIERRRD